MLTEREREELSRLRFKSIDDEAVKKRLKQEIRDLKVELKQMRSQSMVMNETVTDEELELFWESRERKDFNG